MSNNDFDDIVVNGHNDEPVELELTTDSDETVETESTESDAVMVEKEQTSKLVPEEQVLFDSLVEDVENTLFDLEDKSEKAEESEKSAEADSIIELSENGIDTNSEFFDDFMEIFDQELSEIPKNEKISEPPKLVKQELLKFEEALDLKGKVEAVVFASSKPVKSSEILDILHPLDESIKAKDIDRSLASLDREYQERSGGFKLVNLKGVGYQFQTCAAAAPIMERLFSSRPRPLSRAALETLSVIAYRQPVTRADIEFIRGVDAGSIIKNLLDRELIACVGRKEDSGRPMLFGTTKEFLKVFSLNSLSDLPPLSAFQPSAEVVGDALKKLNGEEDVDVEGFVGDESRDTPDIGGGVELSNQTELFDENNNDDERQGAISVVEEEFSFDGEDKNTEMVIPDGSDLEKTSGEID